MNKNVKIAVACVCAVGALLAILFQFGVFDAGPEGAQSTQPQGPLGERVDTQGEVEDYRLESGQGVRRYGSRPALIPED